MARLPLNGVNLQNFHVTEGLYLLCFLREKDKLKEREEAWMKIDELARKNPNVSKTLSVTGKSLLHPLTWLKRTLLKPNCLLNNYSQELAKELDLLSILSLTNYTNSFFTILDLNTAKSCGTFSEQATNEKLKVLERERGCSERSIRTQTILLEQSTSKGGPAESVPDYKKSQSFCIRQRTLCALRESGISFNSVTRTVMSGKDNYFDAF